MEVTFMQAISVCRGCLTTERKMVPASIFEAEFKDLTGIVISPSDGLPQWLCYECSALMQKWHKFRNKIITSHSMLSHYVLLSAPFAHDNARPLLTRSGISYCEIPGVDIEQHVEESDTPGVDYSKMPVITKMETIGHKESTIPSKYEYNIIKEETREENDHENDADTNKYIEIDTRQVYTATLDKEGKPADKQGEEIKDMVEVEHIIDNNIEVKVEPIYSVDEDITIEPWSVPNHLEELPSKPAPRKRNTKRNRRAEVVRPKPRAVRQSALRARLSFVEDSGAQTSKRGGQHTKRVTTQRTTTIQRIAPASPVTTSGTKLLPPTTLIIAPAYITTPNEDEGMVIRFHGGEKQYKCDVCAKSFRRKQCLLRHARIHTGVKPYKCDICNKCFMYKQILKQHLQIHNGDKPHKCDICFKSFIKKSDLQRHTRIHTGDKPYKCYTCTQSFTDKSHLDEHMSSHNDEELYVCDICLKSFRYKHNLNRHVKAHNGARIYECHLCPKTFHKKSILKNHIRLHAEKEQKNAMLMAI